MANGQLILLAGVLMVAGLFASRAADRLKVPGLVLFLGIGMALGSDGLGWIEFGDYELARTIGIVALALILFEGGLTASWAVLRPVLRPSLGLAFVGTLLTALIAGVAATWLLHLTLLEGLLLGSIVSATDGAAIFSLLRGSTLRLRIARTLEGEAGFNDPVAVLLVVGLIEWITAPNYGLGDMALLFLRELGIGLVVGLAVGWLSVRALRRALLGNEAAYVIGTLGVAALSYGLASTLHGSGFLAVYLTGLSLGSALIPAKRAVTIFHQGLAQLSQVVMFSVLGLLVFPSQLGSVAVEGAALALVLVFVARPFATLVTTAFEPFSLREKTLLAWAGLRGAVPVVLATFPVIDGVSRSLEFFNIVFFAVLLSTLVQGATFEPLARRLGIVDDPADEDQPRRTRVRAAAQVSMTRPWTAEDGNPAYPKEIAGVPVVEQLATRIDEPGALVLLADGRYAFTGPFVAIGSARSVQSAARRRLERAASDSERAWWREVIGTVAR